MSLGRPFLYLVFCLFAVTIPDRATAQKHPNSSFHFGVEQDIVPYLTGGYFAGIWGGRGHFKVRLIHVKASKPDFLLPDALTDNQIKAYAIVTDYHFTNFIRGWWIGAGIVRWDASITDRAQTVPVSYRLHLLHGSIGYHFAVSNHLYISPWAGLHLKLEGPSEIDTGSIDYRPPFFNPEASLKIGWFF